MGELFSVQVASEAWRTEAHRWIATRLAEVGRSLTGEIEQRRIRPWATQLVVPTDRGTVWFKANCPELAHEVAVHETLSQLVPDEVDVPLAVDPERGWMMTTDRGTTLGDSHEATLEDWRAVVQLAATLQRRVQGSGDRLLGAGLPDCSPPTLVSRYGWLVEQLTGLPAGHPSHLTAQDAQALRARSDVVAEAVDVLLAAQMPPTLQHGDLHPRNVFPVEGGMRIFDFGDSQWAHPLEVLAVPYGYATRVAPMPWQPLLEAYAAVWADLVDVPTIEALLPAAMVAQAVNRSFLWLGAVVGAQEHELAEWGDSPVYYLRLVHEPFPPPGSPAGVSGR